MTPVTPIHPLRQLLRLLLIVCFVYSCANKGPGPTGGPKDETPPRVMKSVPENGAMNFSKQEIQVDFDENISLEKVTEEVVVSPPQQKAPDIRAQGKRLVVAFEDTLESGTTYTIDFGNAIVDLNEKNPLSGYTFSFSTGGDIDTLAIAGILINAEDLNPVSGIIVGIYAEHDDSVFTQKPFLRIGKTETVEKNGKQKKVKAKIPEAEIRQRVMEMLEVVSLKGFENRRINELSGGQQQRVAIARALVNRPKVLLLDEPLGALDLRLRKDMQSELKRIQQTMGITFIYVTHDQEEALAMSDTVVVMDEGKIQQIGTPEDIYNEPKNAFVADFIGESNIIDGIMRADGVVEIFNRRFACLDKGFLPDEPVDVVIRPEDVDIVPEAQGQLKGTVTAVTFKGMQYDIIVDFRGFKWLIQTTDHSPVGARIGVKIDPDGFHIMKKSQYSGMFGDYSSYSDEYDELSDAEALDEEDEGAEEERREEGYAE